ncbi:GNAT family N-acetyltransferase [Microcella frigidaquae]|uniref:Diamine N-acetyltransferase n=1 Tax=Microcella frigidaquae TaxID=424758 RepID=A0A840X932_9MICO|nr:GNAT family N-acetyltransferase [Microcella frigidaquae]MBB5617704.1 diamine N-acetyltransferase [Microcella frigidaquae]NHN45723.1 GNAT family N-acetyltransferase [Microcella frigidaquae]
MDALRLEELSARTIVAANGLTLRPGQEQFVTPVSYSAADAYVNPTTTWARVVLDGDDVVGFIRGNFDPDNPRPEFRSCIWRINVDATAQGRGIGKFAVHALADEARQRGFDTVTVIWETGEEGPGEFFRRIGFVEIGETEYGEKIGALHV